MPPYSLSDPAVLAFFAIPIILVFALIWATAAAWQRSGFGPPAAFRAAAIAGIAALAWMAMTWAVASSGILLEWDRTPPPFGVLVLSIVVISFAMAFSHVGARIARGVPVWALVGVQAFRLPLELAMHGMYTRGIMPVQMSYSGRNFDIVTGITAIVVSALVATGRGSKALVATWNVMGLALLFNVVVVAILGTPRFRFFGDDHLNTWVTYPPFVWLPAVMVLAALAGHLVIFRALSATRPPQV